MPKLRFFFFSIIFLASALTHAEGFDFDIEIDAPSEIRDLLRTHLSLAHAKGQPRTSAEQVKRLADAATNEARELLATQGYFSPTIETNYQDTLNTPTVFFKITPGEAVRVRKLEIQLIGDINNDTSASAIREKIITDWPLSIGSIFKQSDWATGKDRSLIPLYNRAYANAKLVYSDAQVDIAAHAADLTLTIDSGHSYVFGALHFNGLKHYPLQLASEQSPFKEGDLYQLNLLSELQGNLQSQPHFTLALVDTQLPSEPPYIAPVTVDIQEAPRHRLKTGIGYNTDTGPSIDLAYRYLNVADLGLISETKTHIAEFEQSVDTSLTLPSTHSRYEHKIYTGFAHSEIESLNTYTRRIGLSRKQGDFVLLREQGLEYQTEKRELNDGTIERPQSLVAKLSWTARQVDNQRRPRSGRLYQMESAAAYEGILSDETFVYLHGRYAHYWPLGKRSLILARTELGQTFARDETDVPTDWLFRTGGSSSVRGYAYQSLGVKKNASTTPGRVMMASSIETQIQVWKEWSAALFVDSGNAALRWSDLDSQTGVGTGVRWSSPVGTLGADFAYGIAENQWRFHLTMGLSF